MRELIICDSLIEADILIAKLSQNDIPAWCHTRHSHNTSLHFILANSGYPVHVIKQDFDEAHVIINEDLHMPSCEKCNSSNIVSISDNKLVKFLLIAWLFGVVFPATATAGRKCMNCGLDWSLSKEKTLMRFVPPILLFLVTLEFMWFVLAY